MATTTNSKKQDTTAIDEDDDIFYYVGVKASPFAADSAVFGLPPKEVSALRCRFPLSPCSTNVVNGIMLKGTYVAKLISGTPFSVINALAELGYRVVCSTGEAEVLWTLQRDWAARYNVCQNIDELYFERGLWTAALDGNEDRVLKLLQKGVFVDTPDTTAGYTALHYATRSGHYHVCKILLQHGANVNACTRSLRATPLHRAASMGHIKILKLLLTYKADPNLTDVDGRTALHRAIPTIAGSVEGVEILQSLLRITDRTVKDKTGQTVDDVFESWKMTQSEDEKIKIMERLFYHNQE
ncbi:Ankyrin repeat domain-containing protein 39 [Trachymyrmex cornetzi]|uniref:Ankyrin repeat domain-containing protein 39 n=1 Tax=Trachymyrmex cornetzi TaxID=471704 RepID=A0A195DSR3_9HYME|nr:Ankyrin repeat domain-containing protein 39 [Trachymyrmex cornetzi]